MPHGSSEDLLPVDTSSIAEAINIDKQNCSHTNITLSQLEGIILPKAIHYFCQNAEASVYQILWKSKHSIAYVEVENVCMEKRSTRRTIGRARKGKTFHREDREVKNQKHLIPHYLDLWAAHAPSQLAGLHCWVGSERKRKADGTIAMPKILEHVTWSNWDNFAQLRANLSGDRIWVKYSKHKGNSSNSKAGRLQSYVLLTYFCCVGPSKELCSTLGTHLILGLVCMSRVILVFCIKVQLL